MAHKNECFPKDKEIHSPPRPSYSPAFLHKITALPLPLHARRFNLASMNTNFDQPVLQVDSLDVRYGNFQAVKQVSFQVRPREIFGLLGPNGAGKTRTHTAAE